MSSKYNKILSRVFGISVKIEDTKCRKNIKIQFSVANLILDRSGNQNRKKSLYLHQICFPEFFLIANFEYGIKI